MQRAGLRRLSKFLIPFSVLSIGIAVVYCVLRKNPIGAGVRFTPEGGLPDNCIWEHTPGIDFDTYYARGPDGQDAGIGIYLGNHPNFPYADDLPCENGRVLGIKVCWVVLDGSGETTHPLYRTTLLRYQYSVYHPIYVHIWVFADDREELQSNLDALRHLRVRPKVSIFQPLVRNISR